MRIATASKKHLRELWTWKPIYTDWSKLSYITTMIKVGIYPPTYNKSISWLFFIIQWDRN